MADHIILKTSDLTRESKGFAAVQDMKLNVKRGTIHALTGSNGAGKTTIFNIQTEFLQPKKGTVPWKWCCTARLPLRTARSAVPNTGSSHANRAPGRCIDRRHA